MKKNAGRNSYGRITVRHRGGGNRASTASSISSATS
jgi:ribosomal protein L2